MRRLLVAGFIAILAHGAQAADPPELPILRGSFREAPVAYRTSWQGFYVGGQASYTFADMNFANSNSSLVSQLFANTALDELYALPPWFVMGTSSDKKFGYGAFAGYNWQWEDAVIGIDANYTRGALSSADGGSRTSEPPYSQLGYIYTVTNLTTAALTLHDYGSIRVRGGYSMGSFLPYAFAGLALARTDIDRGVSIGVTRQQFAPPSVPDQSPPPVVPPLGNNSSRKNQVLYGYAVGLGAEYMLFGGLFARAEWEHMRFNSVVNVGMHTVRGGLGYKF